jgi:hypothetical protein
MSLQSIGDTKAENKTDSRELIIARIYTSTIEVTIPPWSLKISNPARIAATTRQRHKQNNTIHLTLTTNAKYK